MVPFSFFDTSKILGEDSTSEMIFHHPNIAFNMVFQNKYDIQLCDTLEDKLDDLDNDCKCETCHITRNVISLSLYHLYTKNSWQYSKICELNAVYNEPDPIYKAFKKKEYNRFFKKPYIEGETILETLMMNQVFS